MSKYLPCDIVEIFSIILKNKKVLYRPIHTLNMTNKNTKQLPINLKSQYGKPQDIIYFLEPWWLNKENSDIIGLSDGMIVHKSGSKIMENRWIELSHNVNLWEEQPSHTMPEWGIRLQGIIEDISVLKMDDLSDEDKIKESIGYNIDIQKLTLEDKKYYINMFHNLWNSYVNNDKYVVSMNPWIWKILFSLETKNL